MLAGLSKILEAIRQTPANRTLMYRYLALVSEVESSAAKESHLIPLARAYMSDAPVDALMVARAIYRNNRKSIEALEIASRCLEKLGLPDRIKIVGDEIRKLQSEAFSAKSIEPIEDSRALEPALVIQARRDDGATVPQYSKTAMASDRAALESTAHSSDAPPVEERTTLVDPSLLVTQKATAPLAQEDATIIAQHIAANAATAVAAPTQVLAEPVEEEATQITFSLDDAETETTPPANAPREMLDALRAGHDTGTSLDLKAEIDALIPMVMDLPLNVLTHNLNWTKGRLVGEMQDRVRSWLRSRDPATPSQVHSELLQALAYVGFAHEIATLLSADDLHRSEQSLWALYLDAKFASGHIEEVLREISITLASRPAWIQTARPRLQRLQNLLQVPTDLRNMVGLASL